MMVDETNPDPADDAEIAEPAMAGKPRNWPRRIFGTVFVLLIILLTIGWWQRINIAERFAQDRLDGYDVQASYEIKDIGLRTQRLENLVLGDPANPDLTADLVEIDVAINFSGGQIRDVRAKGVRLNGRYADGRLSFGELDKFADPNSKEPFELPDIGLELSDAAVSLQTPWGPIGAVLNGEGLLRQGFEGKMALRSPKLQYEDCQLESLRFDGQLILDFRQPKMIGPWIADGLSCDTPGLDLELPKIDGELRLSERFDRWFGEINYAVKSAKYRDIALSRPRGTLQFDGNENRTNFETKLKGASYASAPIDVRNLRVESKGHADFSGDVLAVTARGEADVIGGRLTKSYLAGIDNVAKSARETPMGPLLTVLAPAMRRAISDFDGQARYDAAIGAGGQSVILIDGIDLLTRSGARVRQSGIAQLQEGAGGWQLTSPAEFALSGGNLPSMRLALKQGGNGGWSGDVSLDRYTAKNASLFVPDLAFRNGAGGDWLLNGTAKLSGPIPQGFITGLELPIDGRLSGRNFSLYQNCQTLRFEQLRYTDLELGRQAVRFCPTGRYAVTSNAWGLQVNARVPDLRLAGSYAGTPAKLTGGDMRFDLDQGAVINNLTAEYGESPIRVNTPILRFSFDDGFDSENVRVETGAADALTYFDIAAIDGAFDDTGLSGKLSGANGKIANVPILMDQAEGVWSLIDGDIALEANFAINDEEQVDRFKPLTVPNALITMEDGVINALGTLYEPTTNRAVGDVDIRHVLPSGIGRSLLSVDNLKFDEKLQPNLITPLTLGVIANARGSISGTGRIDWNRDSVTSGGTFGTEDMDVAAAFGPVENLQTEIKFSDLLNFETGPGQSANIGSVNPGIAALDGIIKYQLLPGKKIGIEGGSWPFAGGVLTLEPTVLDFGIAAERRLTFQVVGMNAAMFLQQYDFEDIQVTGIFDGTLPMVFNQQGGRISGGALVSRPGGGELSYLGQLSYKDMGAFSNFAFNALKSIRFNEMEIGMAGPIDGNVVTNVTFTGLQQGTGAKRNFITKQLAKIPIKFNVRIDAEFMKLFGDLRTTYDAQYAAERARDKLEKEAARIRAEKEKDGNENKP